VESCKKRARDKGLEFNIEVTDIVIPNFCPYLGIELSHKTGHGKRRPESPSLDRKDSAKGYTQDNIIVCSWRANFLKSDGTLKEMQLIARQMEKLAE